MNSCGSKHPLQAYLLESNVVIQLNCQTLGDAYCFASYAQHCSLQLVYMSNTSMYECTDVPGMSIIFCALFLCLQDFRLILSDVNLSQIDEDLTRFQEHAGVSEALKKVAMRICVQAPRLFLAYIPENERRCILMLLMLIKNIVKLGNILVVALKRMHLLVIQDVDLRVYSKKVDDEMRACAVTPLQPVSIEVSIHALVLPPTQSKKHACASTRNDYTLCQHEDLLIV